jgi:glycerol kinase
MYLRRSSAILSIDSFQINKLLAGARNHPMTHTRAMATILVNVTIGIATESLLSWVAPPKSLRACTDTLILNLCAHSGKTSKASRTLLTVVTTLDFHSILARIRSLPLNLSRREMDSAAVPRTLVPSSLLKIGQANSRLEPTISSQLQPPKLAVDLPYALVRNQPVGRSHIHAPTY